MMVEETPSRPLAWLVLTTGDLAGARYRMGAEPVRIGRDPENDIVPEGPRAAFVSKQHAEIVFRSGAFHLIDRDSRNGSFLNGGRVEAPAPLAHGDRLRFGTEGPEFEFVIQARIVPEETVIAPAAEELKFEESSTQDADDSELKAAVERARAVRGGQGTGQTLMIMRDLLLERTRLSKRKLQVAIVALTIPLLLVSLYAWRMSQELKVEKAEIDAEINNIEVSLATARDPERIESLIEELDGYQKEAREIQRSLLYRLGLRDEHADFIESEIQRLMADLGAGQYSIPLVFQERVRHYIDRYQGADRSNLEKALLERREDLQQMRRVFGEYNLPPDLAFITVVESAFQWSSVNSNGAAGPWQFVPATARAFGLTVSPENDERFDIEKSTAAAARYIRRLISEFGAGTSAMLALAAYNLGPTRVRRVIRKIEDPIKQRSFWYLYRNRTLPLETREYIPKIVAVIIMLRNPQSFGFQEPAFEPLT